MFRQILSYDCLKQNWPKELDDLWFWEKKHDCTSSMLFVKQKLDAKPFLVLFDIYSVFWGIFNPFTVVWLKNKYCPMILQNKTGQRNSTANDFEGGKWPHRLHTYYKKVTTIEILVRPGPDVPYVNSNVVGGASDTSPIPYMSQGFVTIHNNRIMK